MVSAPKMSDPKKDKCGRSDEPNERSDEPSAPSEEKGERVKGGEGQNEGQLSPQSSLSNEVQIE